MSELLRARRISRAFGDLKAVDRLSFEFPRGQIWGFIGPNGAGKTTTMRILATLDLPDTGNAWIDGVSILEDPQAVRARIGYMSDQFSPYAGLSVFEYLDFFARARGLRGRQRLETIRSVAGFCHLEAFRTRPANGLSKGMGQRLHLAKTLLHDPQLLILDEPASGLDPRARVEFRELIRELADSGRGVLISSHILAEISETCDGVIVIEKGRLVASGPIAAVAAAAGERHRLLVKVIGVIDPAEQFFLVQPHVAAVQATSDGLELDWEGSPDELPELLARAMAQGLRIAEFRTVSANLEQIFMRTTSGGLQ